MVVVVDDPDRENEGDLPEDFARPGHEDDGTTARVPDLVRFCEEHRLLMVTVADLALQVPGRIAPIAHV